LPRVQVYECDYCGEEYEYLEPLEETPPKCPKCGRQLRYITTYEE